MDHQKKVCPPSPVSPKECIKPACALGHEASHSWWLCLDKPSIDTRLIQPLVPIIGKVKASQSFFGEKKRSENPCITSQSFGKETPPVANVAFGGAEIHPSERLDHFGRWNSPKVLSVLFETENSACIARNLVDKSGTETQRSLV